jgi:hypothetical protein
MWIERQMFAIIEEHYKEVIVHNNIRQMLSIKIGCTDDLGS